MPKSKKLPRRTADKVNPTPPTDDEWMELQAIMDGIARLPGVFKQMESYLIGRGFDGDDQHGEEVIRRWRDIAYGDYPRGIPDPRR